MIQKTDGLTLLFHTSGFTGEITEVQLDSDRANIETDSLGSQGDKTSCPFDISKAGMLEIEMHFNPDILPPLDKQPEEIEIRFKTSDTSFTVWSGLGYFVDYSPKGSIRDKIIAGISIKFTGPITVRQIARIKNDDLDLAFNDDGQPAFAA